LAKQSGFDDALLLAQGYGVPDDKKSDDKERVILDGPNFAVSWIRNDGVFCTPSWERLGMLQSITCTLTLAAAKRINLTINEGEHRLDDLHQARSMWVQSTGNDLTPVTRVGDIELGLDSVTRDKLLGAIDEIVAETP
jgi:branched-subunit amino acid aminotransferase/4-amino-4-deoxychorismate lyase